MQLEAETGKTRRGPGSFPHRRSLPGGQADRQGRRNRKGSSGKGGEQREAMGDEQGKRPVRSGCCALSFYYNFSFA